MDLNEKCKTMRLLEENIGENLWYLECEEAFLYVKQKAWSTEENNQQIELDNNWKKILVRRQEDKLQTERKYLQAVYKTNDSYLEYIKNCQNLTVRKQKMVKISEQTFHQRG